MFRNSNTNIGPELSRLIDLLSKLPSLGPKSARRVALTLLKKRETLMQPLADALAAAAVAVKACSKCGNLDTTEPCAICTNETRDKSIICVISDVGDLWALERTQGYRGQYHVLGGLLNSLDGITPDDLRIKELMARLEAGGVKEIVLALSATLDGQSTAHYLASLLENTGVKISRLSHGLPVGGELDHLDEGTLMTALRARLEI